MHDRNGNPIKVGDRVLLEGEITSCSIGENNGWCNVQVKITEKDQEHGAFNIQTSCTVNAKQTLLLPEGAGYRVEVEDPTEK